MNATADKIPAEWVTSLAKCLDDAGYAFRPGHNCTIEIKNLSSNQWEPKELPGEAGGGIHFASNRDRDQIYNALRALVDVAPQTPLENWENREAEMHDALRDGHPNPEGAMEHWYANNPKPELQ